MPDGCSADGRDAVTAELLGLFNQRVETQPLLDRVAPLLREFLGCGAVGIRLMDEQGNIPYTSHTGFSDDFIKKESPLCIRCDMCACINITRGEFDSSLPFYTPYGSFVTTNLQGMEVIREGIKDGRFRGECVRSKWESMALVPIRFAHRYFGLIHVVDDRRDILPEGTVRFLENVASQLGLYIHSMTAYEDVEREFTYMLGRVMHDMRTPITTTMMLTELMQVERPDTLDEQTVSDIGRINSNAEYMLQLLSTLDGFSRSASDGMDAREDVDLNEMVEQALSDAGGREALGVQVSVSDRLPVISYPPLGMRRVLNNLITNAVKFSSAVDGPSVSIACEEKDSFYQLSVSDNGFGMEHSEVEKVFLPFYRSKSARDVPGSGLGLSICKRIVEANGGRIWAYSDKGRGSTFYFTVPK